MQPFPRKVFIGGNWKSNGDKAFVGSHTMFLNNIQYDKNNCEVAVCPVFIHLQNVKTFIANGIYVCAQNISPFQDGAFTGEVTAKQLINLGINWTLVGHSERRQYFHEDEKIIGDKLDQVFANGMKVILCVGEKLADREANKTFEIIDAQIKTVVEKSAKNWDDVVIAYEPVWAIGTGKTATPEQAQEVHDHIRKYISKNVNEEVANKVRIIYGGSVNEKNCNDLIQMKDIDGFLVGGASLKPSFKIIVESYSNKKF